MIRFIKKTFLFLFRKHPYLSLAGLLILFLFYWFCLPSPLFDAPTCIVLNDRKNNLLGARIATDGQWRFPLRDSVPEKFEKAILTFEDKRFYRHPGIDILALGRAFRLNLKRKKVISGGSTLSMQVIRLALKPKSRNIFQKLYEMLLATRLELKYSKKEILAFYASNAPFGGNTVGLDAAAWRYYEKKPELLTWSEASTLAVLPNSPALIHPGRNRQALLDKRNRLLNRLQSIGIIDSITYQLALEEPLPDKPHPLPRLAPHLLDRATKEYFRKYPKEKTQLRTTVNSTIQKQLTKTLEQHQKRLAGNEVHNLAAIVVEVESGDVMAYAGNVIGAGEIHSEQVDVIKAPRSTGSILKPFLYALMLQEGEILPNSLIPDVPTQLSGYKPQNFHESYDGMVSAKRALVRSLNVPMIRMLQDYGLEKLHFQLKKLGLSHINQPPDHYGLPLILGGAEASLWDLTGIYCSMSRVLEHYSPYEGLYDPLDFRKPNYIYQEAANQSKKQNLQKQAPIMSADAIWFTFDAMQLLERPNSQGEWERFSSGKRIAWKTGTSFGFRDAWAIGVTPEYVVGVWAGNADGEGRPGLIGVLAAAPVLFDIFELLPSSPWFDAPFNEMIEIPVCKKSGYRALTACEADSMWVPQNGIKVKACPFHKIIHLDKTEQWQVNNSCEATSDMVHTPWFVLPPIEEHFYKTKNPVYKPVPPYRNDCIESGMNTIDPPMQLIYPKYPTKIFVPLDLNGQLSRTVFKLAHRQAETIIHWHLDNTYIGSTSTFHNMELKPSAGKHRLTLVDENGFRLEQNFEIIERQK